MHRKGLEGDRHLLQRRLRDFSLSTMAGVLLGNNHIDECGPLEQRSMDTKGSDRRLERPRNPETQSGTGREVQATIRAERSSDPALNFNLSS